MKKISILLIAILISGCGSVPYRKSMFRTADIMKDREASTGLSLSIPLGIVLKKSQFDTRPEKWYLWFLFYPQLSFWYRKGLGNNGEIGYTFFPMFLSVGCQIDYKKQIGKEPDFALNPYIDSILGFYCGYGLTMNNIISTKVNNQDYAYCNIGFLHGNYVVWQFEGGELYRNEKSLQISGGVKLNKDENKYIFCEGTIIPYVSQAHVPWIGIGDYKHFFSKQIGVGYQH